MALDLKAASPQLAALESLLGGLPDSDTLARARSHCERLGRALASAHSEGARFAAFTLGHIVNDPAQGFPDAVRRSYEDLKSVLEGQGLRLHH